jgi:Fur family ferric uptake transcriptional regulator
MGNLLKTCLDKGIKLTKQRKEIVRVIEESADHPDVDMIYQRVITTDKNISIATVYRTIAILEQANIIERLDVANGRARYEVVKDHHDHLIDIDSEDIYEFYSEDLEKLKIKIAKDLGFDLVHHRLELYGQKRKSAKK